MSGLMRRCSSYPRPQLRKTRELKFSITMSETAISRLTISRPFAVRTLRLMLFLLTFVSLKFPEVFRLTSRCRGVVVLGNRPRSFSGHSILMISAPKAPSQRVAHGPARTQLKSTTRVPARLFIWTPWYSTEFAHTHPIHRLETWPPPIWNADPPPGAWAFIRPVDPSVVADRQQGVGTHVRRQPECGLHFLLEVQIKRRQCRTEPERSRRQKHVLHCWDRSMNRTCGSVSRLRGRARSTPEPYECDWPNIPPHRATAKIARGSCQGQASDRWRLY